MKRVFSTAAIAATLAAAMPPLPRKSPEFTITEAPGKEGLLSGYRGKVVVLAFVHTTCIHCQQFSAVLVKLHKELGPKGFQPIDVAWNQGAASLVPGFIKQIGIDFPVGYSDWDPIMSYLGFSVMDRPVVPLVVVIDKKGMIRAESPPQGDPNLQDEAKLKALIESLLAEGGASGKTKR
jgi:thiol-disulfide isomerase/thioredoxin